MNIIRFKGGLGNQMFQYAFGVAMHIRGKSVMYDTGFYRRHKKLRGFQLLETFPNIHLLCIEDETFFSLEKKWESIKSEAELYQQNISNPYERVFYIEEGHSEYKADVWNFENCEYIGYWQTEKYFCDIADVIREMYTFTICNEQLNDFSKLLLGNEMYGVHIRRGDYLGTQHEVCNTDYYMQAIKYIKALDEKACFCFFSDDPEWVKKQRFVSEKDIVHSCDKYDVYFDWYDMYLMTLCKGNIISNSSFSWWGAWLAGQEKIVVAPKKWYAQDNAPDIGCCNWIRM